MTTAVAYTGEVRRFAKGLFLEGTSVNRIVKLLKETYPEAAKLNYETVARWKQQENWETQRAAVQRDLAMQTAAKATEVLERQQGVYEQMIDAGEVGIKALKPRSLSEAASVADLGMRGQRGAMKELISMDFLKKIVNVLDEEIDDMDTKSRIGARLREIAGVTG